MLIATTTTLFAGHPDGGSPYELARVLIGEHDHAYVRRFYAHGDLLRGGGFNGACCVGTGPLGGLAVFGFEG